ncbi:MAG: HD domain-containing protein, partial [Candidatus Methylomirabilales bacterium]
WTHSLLTLRALEGLWRGPVVKGLARAPIALTAGLDDPVDGAISRGILLKLVALFHDVGKVGTRRQVGTGPIRFPGHAEAGATLFAVIAGRLALGRRPTERGAQAIRHHLRPLMLSQGPQVTRRVAYRFFRDVRPVAEEVLCLGLADNWAKAWRKGRTFVRVERTVRALLAFAPLLTRPTHLLDGHAIQTVLGIGPGPLVGYLLRIVQERGALGELRSAEEAVAFLLAQRESLEKAFREGEVHGGGP